MLCARQISAMAREQSGCIEFLFVGHAIPTELHISDAFGRKRDRAFPRCPHCFLTHPSTYMNVSSDHSLGTAPF